MEACGICHSDVLVKDGLWPGLTYPRIPGHEIAGRVDACGSDVASWKVGQRVGVGWHGGHCFTCDSCRRGDFILCRFEKITALSFEGGYAEYMIAPAEAVVALAGRPVRRGGGAAPLRGRHHVQPAPQFRGKAGDLVAVQGIGGLGHLGVQFAHRMGFRTVAIGRGEGTEALARKLGAHEFIDTNAGPPAEALQRLGGARVILATAPDAKSMSALIDGLAPGGKLVVVGAAPEPLAVSPLQIILARRSIQGWPSGTAKDSEDTLAFSVLSGSPPMVERYPLNEASAGYEQMMSGRARFRVVLAVAS